MPFVRNIAQFGVTCVSLLLVLVGLYLSLGPTGESVVLDKPGAVARLGSVSTISTAFFEVDGDMVEVTMLFSETDDPNSVFRSRVRLRDGQSHSVITGDTEDAGGSHRFTFRRVGYTVEMRLTPVQTVNASFILSD